MIVKARGVQMVSVKTRVTKPKKRCTHKWSPWTYGGSFKDGSERFCFKCRKVQVS